jgi:hypothetical protein
MATELQMCKFSACSPTLFSPGVIVCLWPLHTDPHVTEALLGPLKRARLFGWKKIASANIIFILWKKPSTDQWIEL